MLLTLLDLLLHPEGSSAAQLTQRYWGDVGNVGLRTDVRTLRQVLESDRPAKDSRYVTMNSRRYRWTTDHSLYWWDAEAFEGHYQRALTSTDPEACARAKEAALALYRGPFVPELSAFRAFAPRRTALQQMVDRLRGIGQKQPSSAGRGSDGGLW